MSWTSLLLGAAAIAETSSAAEVLILIDEPPSLSVTATASTPDEGTIVLDEGPSSPASELLEVVKARASLRFDARVAVDARFERKREQIGQLDLGARLELDVELSERWAFYAAPQFTYVTGLSKDGEDRELLYALFPETQVSFKYGPLLVRAGSLVFSWGSSDLISPIDILNPVDLRRSVFGFGDDTKIPVPAVEGVLNLGPLTLRLAVEPFFTASRFQAVGWDFAVLSGTIFSGAEVLANDDLFSPGYIDRIADELLVTERPKDRIDNATIAGRATLSLGALDLSATAFHGWDTLPRLILDSDVVLVGSAFLAAQAEGRPPPTDDVAVIGALSRIFQALEEGRDLVSGEYLPRNTLGVDATWALDPFIFKADLAYTFERTLYTWAYTPTKVGWLSAVVGFEYFWGDDLQVIVEGFTFVPTGIDSNVRLVYLEPNTPPPSSFPVGERSVAIPGVAVLLRWTLLEGDLFVDLAGGGTFTLGDLAIMPSVAYKPAERHQITLGGTLIEGSDDSYGGVYSHTDQFWLSYRFTY